MCLAACRYAGIKDIVYGAPIEAMRAITGDEVPADFAGGTAVGMTGGLLRDECEALLDRWRPRAVS